MAAFLLLAHILTPVTAPEGLASVRFTPLGLLQYRDELPGTRFTMEQVGGWLGQLGGEDEAGVTKAQKELSRVDDVWVFFFNEALYYKRRQKSEAFKAYVVRLEQVVKKLDERFEKNRVAAKGVEVRVRRLLPWRDFRVFASDLMATIEIEVRNTTDSLKKVQFTSAAVRQGELSKPLGLGYELKLPEPGGPTFTIKPGETRVIKLRGDRGPHVKPNSLIWLVFDVAIDGEVQKLSTTPCPVWKSS